VDVRVVGYTVTCRHLNKVTVLLAVGISLEKKPGAISLVLISANCWKTEVFMDGKLQKIINHYAERFFFFNVITVISGQMPKRPEKARKQTHGLHIGNGFFR
jgi:LytS/YehU family sensor histidine kinase